MTLDAHFSPRWCRLLEADTYGLDALEETLTGESVRTAVLFCGEVTHLEADRRLTLSYADTDMTCRTVVKEWVLERLSITDIKLAHDADFLGADLASISVILTETGRLSVAVTARSFVTEEAALTFVTTGVGEDVTVTSAEAETLDGAVYACLIITSTEVSAI